MNCRDFILPKTFLLRKSLQRTHLTFGESFREKLQLQTFIVCTQASSRNFFWVAEQRTEVCQLLQNLSRQRRELVLSRNLFRPDSYQDVEKLRTTLPASRQGSNIFLLLRTLRRAGDGAVYNSAGKNRLPNEDLNITFILPTSPGFLLTYNYRLCCLSGWTIAYF